MDLERYFPWNKKVKFLLWCQHTFPWVMRGFTYSYCTLRSERSFGNWNLVKMMKNAFCFTLKSLFVLKIFKVLSWLFGHIVMESSPFKKDGGYAIGHWGSLAKCIFLNFQTFVGVKGQSLLSFTCLFQVKFNFSIEKSFFKVASWHQKYLEL